MINTKILKGAHFRAPDRYNKYKDPYDNLLYAMLITAMLEVKTDSNSPERDWLEKEGRQIKEYLQYRPLASLSNANYIKRKNRLKKRIGAYYVYCNEGVS